MAPPRRRLRHLRVGGRRPSGELSTDGPTVAEVPWARHDSAFSRAFEDPVVWQAIVANEAAAARRYAISWRAVNNACVRVATEALGRSDLLEGLVAVAIDEVKYKKGQRYLTVVCDHASGRVVWAAKGLQGGRRLLLRRPGRRTWRPAGLRHLRRGRVDPLRGRRARPRGHHLPGHLPRGLVGERRPRRGPPGGVEQPAPGRQRRGGQGVQGTAVPPAAQLARRIAGCSAPGSSRRS